MRRRAAPAAAIYLRAGYSEYSCKYSCLRTPLAVPIGALRSMAWLAAAAVRCSTCGTVCRMRPLQRRARVRSFQSRGSNAI